MELSKALLIGLGVALVIEGLAYMAGPNFMRTIARAISQTSPQQLRLSGLIAVALGVFIVWLSQL